MSTLSLQITYRKGKPFAAYIYLTAGPRPRSVRTEQVGSDLLIDYDADGSPLGIEIVSPQVVPEAEILATFDRLGIERPSAAELAPLRAA